MMREWTIWFAGLLGIASVYMILAVLPLIKEELLRADTHPAQNRVLKLSLALLIHAGGAVALILSPLAGWLGYGVIAVYVFWAVLGTWLLAKLMIVSSTSGKLRNCLLFMGLWSVVWWATYGVFS